MNRKISLILLTIAAMLSVGGMDGRAQSLMTRHMREAVLDGQAQPLGRLPSNQIMQLNLVLPLRDQAGLDSFLSELYDPSSPSYRQFLSPAEFTERFGPSQADYDALVDFAKANGLMVVGGTNSCMRAKRPWTGGVRTSVPSPAGRGLG